MGLWRGTGGRDGPAEVMGGWDGPAEGDRCTGGSEEVDGWVDGWTGGPVEVDGCTGGSTEVDG